MQITLVTVKQQLFLQTQCTPWKVEMYHWEYIFPRPGNSNIVSQEKKKKIEPMAEWRHLVLLQHPLFVDDFCWMFFLPFHVEHTRLSLPVTSSAKRTHGE